MKNQKKELTNIPQQRLEENISNDREDTKMSKAYQKLRQAYSIPADLKKALIYRNTTRAGIPDYSKPLSELSHQPQKTPYSFFCSKKNKNHQNEVMLLYYQNTLFCIIFVACLFLSQLYIVLINRKYICLARTVQTPCSWFDSQNYLVQPYTLTLAFMIDKQSLLNQYHDDLLFGLRLRLGIILSLYLLPILFVYWNLKLTSKIKLERNFRGKNQDISEYSLMISSEYSSVAKNRAKLRAYLEALLSREGYDHRSVEFVDFYCTTKRTPLEYMNYQVKDIEKEIGLIRSILRDGDFDEKERKKIEKKIQKFRKKQGKH